MRRVVLPSTVKTIRLRHRIMIARHQSHPRQIPGISRCRNWPRNWAYRSTGFTTESTMVQFKWRETRRPAFTCFPMAPRPWSDSANASPESSRTCVFERASRCVIEKSLNVGVEYRTVPLAMTLQDPLHRLVTVASGNEPVGMLVKPRFEDRGKKPSNHFLSHPIANHRNAERSELRRAGTFGDVDATQGAEAGNYRPSSPASAPRGCPPGWPQTFGC